MSNYQVSLVAFRGREAVDLSYDVQAPSARIACEVAEGLAEEAGYEHAVADRAMELAYA